MPPLSDPGLTRWMDHVDHDLDEVRRLLRENREQEVKEHQSIRDELGGLILRTSVATVGAILIGAFGKGLLG